jgi:hypothetical protein
MKHLEKGYPIRHLEPVAQRNVKIFYSGLKKRQMQFWLRLESTTGFDEPTQILLFLIEQLNPWPYTKWLVVVLENYLTRICLLWSI